MLYSKILETDPFFSPSNLPYVLVLEHVVLICPLPFKSQNENERKYLSKTAIQIKDLHLISFSAMLSAVNWSFDCCQKALLKKRNLEITLGITIRSPLKFVLDTDVWESVGLEENILSWLRKTTPGQDVSCRTNDIQPYNAALSPSSDCATSSGLAVFRGCCSQSELMWLESIF